MVNQLLVVSNGRVGTFADQIDISCLFLLFQTADDPLESLISFLTFSMIGYFLLCITFLATTKILLFKVHVRKALLKGNLSVAITMGGICLATSINLRVRVLYL